MGWELIYFFLLVWYVKRTVFALPGHLIFCIFHAFSMIGKHQASQHPGFSGRVGTLTDFPQMFMLLDMFIMYTL